MIALAMTAGLALTATGAVVAPAGAAEPAVSEAAVRNVLDDCRISRSRAREVALVRTRWYDLERPLGRRSGVVTSFARRCRPKIVVQVLYGQRLTALRQLLRRHRVARWTRFQRVRFTLAQLAGAENAIGERVKDLIFDCLVMPEIDFERNGVRILVSKETSREGVAMVRRSAAASRVPTWIERVDATFCPDVD